MATLNEQFLKQAETFMQEVRVPENLQAMAQEGVARSRQAFATVTAAAATQAKAAEKMAGEAHASMRGLGETAIGHLTRNAEAAFDAAEAIAKAKTLPEAVRLQTEFMQTQLAAFGTQTHEMLGLASKVAQQTFEAMKTSATEAVAANGMKAGKL